MKRIKLRITGALTLFCMIGSAADALPAREVLSGRDKIATTRLVAAAMPEKDRKSVV